MNSINSPFIYVDFQKRKETMKINDVAFKRIMSITQIKSLLTLRVIQSLIIMNNYIKLFSKEQLLIFYLLRLVKKIGKTAQNLMFITDNVRNEIRKSLTQHYFLLHRVTISSYFTPPGVILKIRRQLKHRWLGETYEEIETSTLKKRMYSSNLSISRWHRCCIFLKNSVEAIM